MLLTGGQPTGTASLPGCRMQGLRPRTVKTYTLRLPFLSGTLREPPRPELRCAFPRWPRLSLSAFGLRSAVRCGPLLFATGDRPVDDPGFAASSLASQVPRRRGGTRWAEALRRGCCESATRERRCLVSPRPDSLQHVVLRSPSCRTPKSRGLTSSEPTTLLSRRRMAGLRFRLPLVLSPRPRCAEAATIGLRVA